MPEPIEADKKVQEISSELSEDRADQLMGSRFPASAAEAIGRALSASFPEDTARNIGFHLVDWNSDAAFLVALCLYPDRFTGEEIEDGVMSFMHHAPNHVAAAAKLYGQSLQDIFGVGPLESPVEDAQPPDGSDSGEASEGDASEDE